MPNKNYFLNPLLTAEYDKARPSFHSEALKAYHQRESSIIYERALDVGCGTGKASRSLADWARKVFAVDSSEAMLKEALSHERVTYLQGEAENLPFKEAQFDIIFVASSFHWFERRKFFNEVNRLLKPGGVLLIYDSFLLKGLSPDFSRLFSEKFPRPYKDSPLNDLELDFFNLKCLGNYIYDVDRNFRKEDVLNYFLSLSNITACLEKGMDLTKIREEVKELIDSQSTSSPFQFQIQLVEIKKKN